MFKLNLILAVFATLYSAYAAPTDASNYQGASQDVAAEAKHHPHGGGQGPATITALPPSSTADPEGDSGGLLGGVPVVGGLTGGSSDGGLLGGVVGGGGGSGGLLGGVLGGGDAGGGSGLVGGLLGGLGL